MSPLGNHTLTIFVEDDEGFQAEATIPYLLREDSKPTGMYYNWWLLHASVYNMHECKCIIHSVAAIVPPLVVSFISDSPQVLGDSVEADILISRPVQSLVCKLKGTSTSVNEVIDCESHKKFLACIMGSIYYSYRLQWSLCFLWTNS